MDESDFACQYASADAGERANLLSESLWGASGFLSAVPSKTLGLAMAPNEFIEELKVRLWIPTFPADHFCPTCDTISDSHGFHARRCTAGGDMTACHHATRNQIYCFTATAGWNPTLEQSHLLPPRPDDPSGSNLRRPADVYLPSWAYGSPAAFDLAITSPQRQEVLAQASRERGAAAAQYEDRKRSYLNTAEECRQQGILFVPLVAETSGGWGSNSLAVLQKMAKRMSGRAGVSTDGRAVLPQLLERLCITIRAAKARAVLRRAGCFAPGADAAAVDSAAAVLAADA